MNAAEGRSIFSGTGVDGFIGSCVHSASWWTLKVSQSGVCSPNFVVPKNRRYNKFNIGDSEKD